jgi:hypothetical protein
MVDREASDASLLLIFVDYSRMAQFIAPAKCTFTPALIVSPSCVVVRQGSEGQSMLVEIEPSAGWAMRLHLVVPGVCGDRGGDDPPITGEAGIGNGPSMDYAETGVPLFEHLEVACPVVALEVRVVLKVQLADVDKGRVRDFLFEKRLQRRN